MADGHRAPWSGGRAAPQGGRQGCQEGHGSCHAPHLPVATGTAEDVVPMIGYSPRRVRNSASKRQPRAGLPLFELRSALRSGRLRLAPHLPGLRRSRLPQPSAGRRRPAARLRPAGTALVVITRTIAPARGGVALPGGFVDHGEDWRHAVVRELKEETGIEAASRDVRLADAMSSPDGHLLLFGLLPERPAADLPALRRRRTRRTAGTCCAGRPELAFPLHTLAVRRLVRGPLRLTLSSSRALVPGPAEPRSAPGTRPRRPAPSRSTTTRRPSHRGDVTLDLRLVPAVTHVRHDQPAPGPPARRAPTPPAPARRPRPRTGTTAPARASTGTRDSGASTSTWPGPSYASLGRRVVPAPARQPHRPPVRPGSSTGATSSAVTQQERVLAVAQRPVLRARPPQRPHVRRARTPRQMRQGHEVRQQPPPFDERHARVLQHLVPELPRLPAPRAADSRAYGTAADRRPSWNHRRYSSGDGAPVEPAHVRPRVRHPAQPEPQHQRQRRPQPRPARRRHRPDQVPP